MKIANLSEAEKRLSRFVPPARKYREAVLSLEGMRSLMDALGNPQDSLRVIHVAGSSGKTSTAYYIAALLKQSGKKVGLTVSPHIDSVNERVQVQMQPLSEDKFCTELETFLELIKKSTYKPTYFEVLVAFAYWYFSKEKLEFMVVEVGLGGLLDATNVITRKDKVCVITDIGLDHTELLGNSLTKIASQKAGIIHDHNQVFSYQQSEEVSEVIQAVAQAKRAKLTEILPVKRQDIAESMPLFQFRNWYLASCVVEEGLGIELNDEQLMRSTRQYIPGRMEVFKKGSKNIILDGAHNAQKMRAFIRSAKHSYPGTECAALIGMLRGKNDKLRQTLQQLLPHLNHIVITTFNTQQDLRKVSADPAKIVEILESLDFHNYEIAEEPQAAYYVLLSRPEKTLLITGSFYLQQHVRGLLQEKV